MAELKQSRWVKVHEPGQGNFVENENVMDITIGTGRCQAEATYTVRSYKKAAYWMNEYLKAAEALNILANEIMETIQAEADKAGCEDAEISASGESWYCGIEKMADGCFKVHLDWTVNEPVTKKGKAIKPKVSKSTAKKRGCKKKPSENTKTEN